MLLFSVYSYLCLYVIKYVLLVSIKCLINVSLSLMFPLSWNNIYINRTIKNTKPACFSKFVQGVCLCVRDQIVELLLENYAFSTFLIDSFCTIWWCSRWKRVSLKFCFKVFIWITNFLYISCESFVLRWQFQNCLANFGQTIWTYRIEGYVVLVY